MQRQIGAPCQAVLQSSYGKSSQTRELVRDIFGDAAERRECDQGKSADQRQRLELPGSHAAVSYLFEARSKPFSRRRIEEAANQPQR
jgi:hypothetical protein